MAESTTTAPAARESGDLGAPDGFAAGDQPAVLRDFGAFVETAADGNHRLNLLVEGVHQARLNLTTRRLALAWHGSPAHATALAQVIEDLGYRPVPFAPQRLEAHDRRLEAELLRSLAVAGFAAANVMMLSVAIWAGYFEGMGVATRDLLHWVSALIALPAIVYAGRPFFRSALTALGAGHTNMDVPISLAVVLAAAMSLFETIEGGRYVYFDSAVTLLFFLLIGRPAVSASFCRPIRCVRACRCWSRRASGPPSTAKCGPDAPSSMPA
jgi:Cu2+-exporting ATPase